MNESDYSKGSFDQKESFSHEFNEYLGLNSDYNPSEVHS